MPIEALRRRVGGQVEVLSKDEESDLEEYCIEMAD